jgi:DNA polymerase-3 subunit gamma/tau
MSYLVLARKWRPQGFDDLIGQQPIVRILTNAIEQDKIAHAYVFSGPRGVGKTSTARILAKALNCEKGPTSSPCGSCPSCTSITDGYSVDVMEIDGASNNSVDDIRDLRERVKYAPSGGRYKVYIIDESHMLSVQAFNALLKTLEEPPPHVVFVLATTAPRKIPPTVMSRCQHLPFRRVSTQGIRERLKLISGAEGINISDKALGIVARAADGSIRDSLTILDQVASFSSEINESDVKDLLGLSDLRAPSEVTEAVIDGDRKRLLDLVAELVDRGTDLRAFTKDLIQFFRDLMVVRLVSDPGDMLDVSEEELGALRKIGAKTSDEHLALLLSELIKAEQDVRTSISPRIVLEMSLMRMSYLSMFKPLSEAIAAIRGAPPRQEPRDDLPPPPVAPEAPKAREPRDGALEVKEPLGAEALFKSIIEEIKDPRVSSKLSKARPELRDETLVLTFSGSGAEICAEPFKDDTRLIEEIASSLRKAPTRVVIKVEASKTPRRKDLKDKVMSEPLVKEALELFEGRVVDVRKTGEP